MLCDDRRVGRHHFLNCRVGETFSRGDRDGDGHRRYVKRELARIVGDATQRLKDSRADLVDHHALGSHG
jgi:hypothetical protein